MRRSAAIAILLMSLLGIVSFARSGVTAIANSHLSSGGWVSGGGDPLRLMFVEGQRRAYHTLFSATSAQLEAVLKFQPAAVHLVPWFHKNHDALLFELNNLKLDWKNVERANCALTDFTPQAVIDLSIPACRSVRSPDDAAELLIHEILHHLGVRDEHQADLWANFLYRGLQASASLPWCEPNEISQAYNSRIVGTWKLDESLNRRLKTSERDLQIRIEEEATKRDLFPGFLETCALMSGFIEIKRKDDPSRRFPYVILQRGLHPYLLFLESNDGQSADYEGFYVTFVPAQSAQDDLFFVGDDHPENMAAMSRMDGP